MDIVKALVLAGTARLFVTGIAPPKRAAESRGGKAAVYKGQLFEYLVRSLAYIACVSAQLRPISLGGLTQPPLPGPCFRVRTHPRCAAPLSRGGVVG